MRESGVAKLGKMRSGGVARSNAARAHDVYQKKRVNNAAYGAADNQSGT